MQGYTGAGTRAAAARAPSCSQTDGTTTYSLESFDDGGGAINPALHTYPVDGASPGLTTDFPPTVAVRPSPVLPLATERVTVTATVNDRESPIGDSVS